MSYHYPRHEIEAMDFDTLSALRSRLASQIDAVGRRMQDLDQQIRDLSNQQGALSDCLDEVEEIYSAYRDLNS